jgi:hypothetical protein
LIKEIDKNPNAQQKVLCNWGMTLKQSPAGHIQALVSADGILQGSGFKLHLLVKNLASGSRADGRLFPSLHKTHYVIRQLMKSPK